MIIQINKLPKFKGKHSIKIVSLVIVFFTITMLMIFILITHYSAETATILKSF